MVQALPEECTQGNIVQGTDWKDALMRNRLKQAANMRKKDDWEIISDESWRFFPDWREEPRALPIIHNCGNLGWRKTSYNLSLRVMVCSECGEEVPAGIVWTCLTRKMI
jgi:hypothetical protein